MHRTEDTILFWDWAKKIYPDRQPNAEMYAEYGRRVREDHQKLHFWLTGKRTVYFGTNLVANFAMEHAPLYLNSN